MQVSQRNLLPSHRLLQKATSLPSLADTASSSSLDQFEEEPRRLAVRWVLAYSRKVGRDTQYLAISYLSGLQARGVILTH